MSPRFFLYSARFNDRCAGADDAGWSLVAFALETDGSRPPTTSYQVLNEQQADDYDQIRRPSLTSIGALLAPQ
jgi:hypothetical protein